MVGIPRSKGCRICVQRRVKCDQTKPFCNNCLKGNRPCPGYAQDMKFQDEGPRLRQQFEKKKGASPDPFEESKPHSSASAETEMDPSSSSDSAGSSYGPYAGTWDIVALDMQQSRQPRFFGLLQDPGQISLSQRAASDFLKGGDRLEGNISGGRVHLDDPFHLIQLHSGIFSPALVQDQLLFKFTNSVVPVTQDSFAPQMSYWGRMLAHLPVLAGTNLLLDTAVRAVTLAHLGRINQNEVLLTESRPYYGKALRLLNTNLLDPVKGMASETLSATVLLSFYEMFTSDSTDSWIRHAGGAGALMRIRGAAKHRYGFDREIYLAYRFALIIEAFYNDTACFLEEPAWRELSRQIHEDLRESGAVSERIDLFDSAEMFFVELVRIPSLMQEAQRWREIGSVPEFKEQLLERATMHRTNLMNIYEHISTTLREANLQPKSYMVDDDIFPVCYSYANIHIGSLHVGYWTTLMILNMLIRELDGRPEVVEIYTQENRTLALNCCRSTADLTKSSFLGPFFIIFGLRSSLENLDPPRERQWIVARLMEIAKQYMAMAKHLPEIAPSEGIPRRRSELETEEQEARMSSESE